MESIWGKFKRYFRDLNDKPIGEKYNRIVNLIDAFIEGNHDFFLSNFEEYSDNSNSELSKLDYDEFTKKAIYRFMLEFEYMFPNVLSEEELLKRISTNLSKSIIVGSIEEDEDEKSRNIDIFGKYNYKIKAIFIDKDLCSDQQDTVLFHEFLHCITIKDTDDRDLESDFITETFVSLMENNYNKAVNNSKSRCNNYIINYAKELEIIFDEELFNVYINNYRDISPLFDYYPVKEYDNKTILHNFVLIFNTIDRLIKSGKDTDLLRYSNAIFEFNLTLLLENYLKNNSNLSNYDKYKKINELFNIQKDPNVDLYRYMINKYYDNDVLLNQFPDLRYIKDNAEVGKLDPFTKEKCELFEIAKLYGFTEIQDYKNNRMFADNNIFYSYPSLYYKDYLQYDSYYMMLYELKTKYDIDLAGYDLFEVFPEYLNNSDSMRDEMLIGADYTNDILYDYRRRNIQDHQFMIRAVKDDNLFYVENASGLILYEKKSIESLVDTADDSLKEVLKESLANGIEDVFVSNTNKNIITEKDNTVNCYIYKRFKKSYGKISHELNDINCSIENGYQKKL